MEQLKKMIEEQRKGRENSPIWMVGEQLLDLASESAINCELLKKDLEVKEMDLEHAEKQIKAWADKQKKVNNCVCVSPKVADEILRTFYGLAAKADTARVETVAVPEEIVADEIDLSAFL